LLPPSPTTASRINWNAASEAMTAPKPTRLAVLKIGSSEALAPSSTLRVICGSRFRLQAITTSTENTSAAITDQMPPTCSTLVSP
jgi:hypothetical protein